MPTDPKQAPAAYLAEIARIHRGGDATEHSYRPALKALLEALLPGRDIVNEPAGIDCGAPDMLVRGRDGARRPAGYVETKAPGDADLDGSGPNREQFDRYKAHLHNVLFTDYLDFRCWQDGQFRASVRIADLVGGRIRPAPPETLERFAALVAHFGAAKPPPVTSPARLARLMAGKARLLAAAVRSALAADPDCRTPLAGQYLAFRRALIHDLAPDAFADIYAQTLAYAFFAARLHDSTPEDFSREEAARLIPRSNPLLRRLFLDIESDLDDSVAWIVDDLVSLFAASDVRAIMGGYGKNAGVEDPVLHFYEDFLAEYDPALRKKRGVWYTPVPVVRFIVAAVDRLLARDFGLPAGLADNSTAAYRVADDSPASPSSRQVERTLHRVQLLDPAAGTGTFLAEAVRLIHARFAAMQGAWPDYAARHLLPRLNGFEILMASYAMAHLKLDLLLDALGAPSPLPGNAPNRLRLFLANSLEEHHPDTGTLWAAALAHEAREANYLKRDCPVMVVLGNPPYSGVSSNNGEWITRLLDDYKVEPGGREKLQERKNWLNDDYVKFIRLGQHYVERTGEGIVAYITPHGFLDNPTFRGMRWRLAETFDEIYILNLHGNTKKKETAPDGTKDENVFDITQGVSINLFVKHKTGKKRPHRCTVRYADLFGTRESKYTALQTLTLDTVPWQPIELRPPYYFFVPKDFSAEEEYNKGFRIDELMPLNTSGYATANDPVNISFSHAEQVDKLNDLLTLEEPVWRDKYGRGKDSRDWRYATAKEDATDGLSNIRQTAYRPFDTRFTPYTGHSRGLYASPQQNVMNQFIMGGNIGLCCIRIRSRDEEFPVFVTDKITDKTILSSKDNANVFPLYIYSEGLAGITKTPNLNPAIVTRFEETLRATAASGEPSPPPTPEDIFHYVYAVLHTPSYRTRYKEFLKIDFPRIPYPSDAAEFRRLAEIGAKLVDIHLLRAPETRDMFAPVATFPVAGSNRIDAIRRDATRVWINPTQYFDNIPEEAWTAHVGGYQPARKWLQDRKNLVLTFDDLSHYKSLLLALLATHRLVALLPS